MKIVFYYHNIRNQIVVFVNSLSPSYRIRHIRVLCTDHCMYECILFRCCVCVCICMCVCVFCVYVCVCVDGVWNIE